jgi:hypothetical protein
MGEDLKGEARVAPRGRLLQVLLRGVLWRDKGNKPYGEQVCRFEPFHSTNSFISL